MVWITDDQLAFLRTITAQPDEDTPRLVYADWLEERGDPCSVARAVFIRIQIELERMDRSCDDYPQRTTAMIRESEQLLKHYQHIWLNELPAPVASVGRGLRLTPRDFSRGFIETFKLNTRTFLTTARELLTLAPVRQLELVSSIQEVRQLVRRPELCLVRALQISGTAQRYPQRMTRYLANSPFVQGLEELTLSSMRLTDRCVRWCVDSPNLATLRVLRLANNHISLDGLRTVMNSPIFANLERLDLRGNYVFANEEFAASLPEKIVLR